MPARRCAIYVKHGKLLVSENENLKNFVKYEFFANLRVNIIVDKLCQEIRETQSKRAHNAV